MLNFLDDLSVDQLIEYFYSPRLVKKDVDGWPWRQDESTEKLLESAFFKIEQKRNFTEVPNGTKPKSAQLEVPGDSNQ